ncbi:MAG: M23 family metallopeptidase [Clostridiales bacterium]|nr:M23 family metallopeptidase [Clostridiales bacterium]
MKKANPDRLPLDLPVPIVRPRSNVYREGFGQKKDETQKTTSLLRKIIISVIIAVIVLILRAIDTDFTQNAIGYIKNTIENDINMDETLGKLKFVKDYLPESITAFGQQHEEFPVEDKDFRLTFMIPAEGRVIRRFSKNNPGIDIKGTDNGNIYAVAGGIVVASGDDKDRGKYIRISHEGDVVTAYEGCSQLAVNVGDNVAGGDKIGTMGRNREGDYILHFQSLVKGTAADPLDFIETGK